MLAQVSCAPEVCAETTLSQWALQRRSIAADAPAISATLRFQRSLTGAVDRMLARMASAVAASTNSVHSPQRPSSLVGFEKRKPAAARSAQHGHGGLDEGSLMLWWQTKTARVGHVVERK